MSRNLFQYHPLFGYSFIPGVKARIEHEGGGYLVQTNHAGFRNSREIQNAKPAGKFRILVFGDSFTAGDGVSNRDRYTEVLETLLPNAEVHNFALPGSGTDQQYLVWREFAHSIEHDLAIIAVQHDNIRRAAARFRMFCGNDGNFFVQAKPYFTLEADGRLELHHVPPPKETMKPDDVPPAERPFVDWSGQQGRHSALRKLITRMGPRVKSYIQHLTRNQPCPDYNRADNPAWLLQKAILKNWASELKTPAIIFPIPPYQYIEGMSTFRYFQARFDEVRQFPNCTLVDPLPQLRSYSNDERRGFRFVEDPHPTPACHQALAKVLADVIRPKIETANRSKLQPIAVN